MNIAPSVRHLWMLAGLFLVPTAAADEPAKNSGKPAAKSVSVSGLLLAHEPAGAWKPLLGGAAVPSGSLLVGMPRVELVSNSGAVALGMLADVGNRGPFPVLESAIILHDAAGADLDLSFKRGIIVLENIKKAGDAKVRLRVEDETWLLTLQTPGTKVGLEIFGRHAPARASIAEKNDVPTTDLLMLVVSGRAFLDTGKEGMAMHAAPGVARLHWDSVLREHSFQRLDKLPETLVQFLDDQKTKVFKDLCADTAKLAQGDLATGLDNLSKSQDRLDRLVGLTLAGAVDDLPPVFGVLMESPDAATRDHAVLVLRHWLGREPGQIKKLETALMSKKKLTEVQARNVVQLLLGFDGEQRANPETYALLLAYLEHKNQAVRTLANWHLVRLAPAGKDIAFDAAAPDEQRRQAVQRWHALIPEGQLPPPSKSGATQKS
jgi:hypothetical protein